MKILMEGRCAISDLSDPIRPQKVSEMFNELYDNQWTEAFEWLVSQAKTADDRSDRVVTKQLLDILMVYDIMYYMYMYLYLYRIVLYNS